MLTAQERRMLSNAVRQVIVAEENPDSSYDYITALSKNDTVDDFKRLHRKIANN